VLFVAWFGNNNNNNNNNNTVGRNIKTAVCLQQNCTVTTVAGLYAQS
jgi:hypothetical protein